jgi:hypothetical protein
VVFCPASVTLSSTTQEPLSSVFPTYKTGIGIAATMQANPTTTNWNGAQLTESLSQVSNTCPSGMGNQCTGSSTFTVGNNGQTAVLIDGQRLPPVENIFYDEHAATATYSALDQYGSNGCTATCTQTYSCGGIPMGTFAVTRTYTKGTINGTAVTNVNVTKQ